MINLNKVELTKKGQSINLEKKNENFGEILVNLNWNQKSEPVQQGFFANLFGKKPEAITQGIDLDLGCLYELTNGEKSCIQALGNKFGNLNHSPYISLDGDDRTGEVSGGENLRINGNNLKEIKRILVYSFIYEGVANWSEADGIVTLKYSAGSDVEVKLDEPSNGKRMCAIAMIENINNETFKVERLVEYFGGHQEMDRAFGWNMNWVAGRK